MTDELEQEAMTEFVVPIRQVNLPPGAEHGIHFTAVTSTSLNPVQLLLPRDVYRAKAVILACDQAVVLATSKEMAQAASNQAQVSGSQQPSYAATDSALITAGGQTIVSEGLPAGTYTVTWALVLGGTTSVSDDDNCQLMVGATVVEPAVNGSTVSQPYPQVPVVVTVPSGGATLSVQSIGAGSGTATYRVQLVAQPESVAQGITSSPSGAYLPSGIPVTIDHCEEVWLAATSSTAGRVSVFISQVAYCGSKHSA